MPSLRKRLIYLLNASILFLLFGNPSFSEMSISQQGLSLDGGVEESYQAGSGLPVGKIQALRGEAVIFHQDLTVGYRAKTGLPLYQGDTISTRSEARILCRLVDGGNFSLAEETTLSILKCNYNFTRKTGMSSLYLKHGTARFKVRRFDELSSLDFQLQTEAISATTNDAEFVISTTGNGTDLTTFAKSRLEVTPRMNPQRVFFIYDLQRMVLANDFESPAVEAVSLEEAETLRTKFSLLPTSKVFVSSAAKYRTKDSD